MPVITKGYYPLPVTKCLDYALGSAPSSFKPGQPSSLSSPSTPPTGTLVPSGEAYIAYMRRKLRNLSFEEDYELERERIRLLNEANKVEEDQDLAGLGEEQESKELLELDPKEWKEQDHYAVLGLQNLRYKATPKQIQIAHRRKVLRHHPDKKAGSSGLSNDDSFFKCIAKAFEILSNPEKRRQFDSVDPVLSKYDDMKRLPSGKEPAEDFFKLWKPVFEREGRFSEPKNGPIPDLGDENSSKEQVDAFYAFFYSFDSWRSFEYQDKEINEGSDNRDDKRYTEKKNRSERAAKKKADNVRVREIVDKALSLDPRIKKFKAEAKAARDAKKKGGPARVNGSSASPAAKLAEEKKKKEEEKKLKKQEEEKKAEAEKAGKADAKKAKEAAKKNLKKEKKLLRGIITGENYFCPKGSDPDPKIIEAQLNELDAICSKLEPEEVQQLREKCEKGNAKETFKEKASGNAFD